MPMGCRRGSASWLSPFTPVEDPRARRRCRRRPRPRRAPGSPQELTKQRAPAGSQRRTDDHLPPPARTPDQLEVSEVGAGDEQHEPHRAEQHQDRRADRGHHGLAEGLPVQPEARVLGNRSRMRSPNPRSSWRACSTVTPGRRRPTTLRK